MGFFQKIAQVARSKVYIFIVLSLAFMYFIVTGIQFWSTDYFTVVLGEPQQRVFVYFSIICVTAPTLGTIMGGVVTSANGGYNSPSALGICVFVMFIGTVCALPVPFLNSFIACAFLVWILLFCGGFTLPVMTGIMLGSVHPLQRTVANSLANLAYNILGYLPAPFLYGFICSVTGGEQSRYGMGMLMYSTFFACVFLFVALIYQLKKRQVQQFYIPVQHSSGRKHFPHLAGFTNSQEPMMHGSAIEESREFLLPHSHLREEEEGFAINESDRVRAVSSSLVMRRPQYGTDIELLQVRHSHQDVAFGESPRAGEGFTTVLSRHQSVPMTPQNRLKMESVNQLMSKTIMPMGLGIIGSDKSQEDEE